MKEFFQFYNRFFEIMEGNKDFRDKRLSVLMTDMEQVYNIPMLHSLKFANENPEVMHLYKQASNARTFEEVKA